LLFGHFFSSSAAVLRACAQPDASVKNESAFM